MECLALFAKYLDKEEDELEDVDLDESVSTNNSSKKANDTENGGEETEKDQNKEKAIKIWDLLDLQDPTREPDMFEILKIPDPKDVLKEKKSFEKVDALDSKCPICVEFMINPIQFNCNHRMCIDCAQTLVKGNSNRGKKCPICR